MNTKLFNRLLTEANEPDYNAIVITIPFNVYFCKDCGEADDEREHSVHIEDQQSFRSAMLEIYQAQAKYGKPDYYVVDNDDFGSVPFTSIAEVRDFVLQSELVSK